MRPGRSPVIVFYNRPPDIPEEKLNLSMEGFYITTDKSCMDRAAAIIFDMQTLLSTDAILKPGVKKDGQLWVFWSTESELRYRWQYEPEILGMFDITATYRLDADVPLPYFRSNYYGLLRKEPVEKTGFVNTFISGVFDQSGRSTYLKELMSLIEVHSYGKVLNNMFLMQDEGVITKQKIIAGYKFTLSFENALAKDYVTSMLYDPLVAGSVPVYLGAPNVEEFVPGDHCYIDVSSFSSVRALAGYLLMLDNDDTRYEEYLKWKTRPYRLAFNLKANFVAKHPLVKLCHVLRARMEEPEPVSYDVN